MPRGSSPTLSIIGQKPRLHIVTLYTPNDSGPTALAPYRHVHAALWRVQRADLDLGLPSNLRALYSNILHIQFL